MSDIRKLAHGRWEEIYRTVEPDLYTIFGRKGHMPCPVHGGAHGDAFRWFLDGNGGAVCNTCGAFHDGIEVLRWYWQAGYKHVFDEVARALGVQNASNPQMANKMRQQGEVAKRIFSAATPGITGVALEYLEQRGALPRILRLVDGQAVWTHPGLRHPLTKEVAPALLLKLVAPDGELRGAHGIFLEGGGRKYSHGKAKLDVLTLGSLSAVRCETFRLNGKRVAVTEGFEDSLAVAQLTGDRPWAVLGTAGMRSFRLPGEAEELAIYYDSDTSFAGKAAAYTLAAKYAPRGIKVEVIGPPERCKDWGDAMQHHAQLI